MDFTDLPNCKLTPLFVTSLQGTYRFTAQTSTLLRILATAAADFDKTLWHAPRLAGYLIEIYTLFSRHLAGYRYRFTPLFPTSRMVPNTHKLTPLFSTSRMVPINI